ncbi:MAG: hypothetical protein BJ554DRAFT_7157, partial [Olpidium bornovanus]
TGNFLHTQIRSQSTVTRGGNRARAVFPAVCLPAACLARPGPARLACLLPARRTGECTRPALAHAHAAIHAHACGRRPLGEGPYREDAHIPWRREACQFVRRPGGRVQGNSRRGRGLKGGPGVGRKGTEGLKVARATRSPSPVSRTGGHKEPDRSGAVRSLLPRISVTGKNKRFDL